MIHLASVLISNVLNLPILADALGDEIGNKTYDVINPTNATSATSTIQEFVQSISNLAVPLGIFSCGLLLSIAAFKMVTSQGNPEKLAEAKEYVSNALTGFALIVLSVVILLLINDALNLGIRT